MKYLSILLLFLFSYTPVYAQTNPGFVDGLTLCATVTSVYCQGNPPFNSLGLNQAFANKADFPFSNSNFAGVEPITVTFPSSIVTISFDYSHVGTFTALQTFTKGITTSPGSWFTDQGAMNAVINKMQDRTFTDAGVLNNGGYNSGTTCLANSGPATVINTVGFYWAACAASNLTISSVSKAAVVGMSTANQYTVAGGALPIGMAGLTIVDATGASFTGTISGTTLTVTAVASGNIMLSGTISGGTIAANTTITSYISGTGLTGTYGVSVSQTVSTPTSITETISVFGWGGYSECVGTTAFSLCAGHEVDLGKIDSNSGVWTMYANIGLGGNYSNFGVGVNCGGSALATIQYYTCSAAIVINTNPGFSTRALPWPQFDKGLIITPDSLVVQATGFTNAINLFTGQCQFVSPFTTCAPITAAAARINWWRNNGGADQLAAYIQAVDTGTGTVIGLNQTFISLGGTTGAPAAGSVVVGAQVLQIQAPSANNVAFDLGLGATGDRNVTMFFGASVSGSGNDANISRLGGVNSQWQFNQIGTGTTIFSNNGTNSLFLTSTAVFFPTYSNGVATISGGTGQLTSLSVLPLNLGGTGTGTAFTAGSIVFAGASGVYSQKNANLFWDNTNNNLGIGTATPTNFANFTTITMNNSTGSVITMQAGGVESMRLAAVSGGANISCYGVGCSLNFQYNGTNVLSFNSATSMQGPDSGTWSTAGVVVTLLKATTATASSSTSTGSGIFAGGIGVAGTSFISSIIATAGGGLQVGIPTGGDKGAGTLNVAGGIYTNGTQGLASKTCTINTTTVASGITLTITNGIVTATTTC